jgi:hypothetical protein
MSWVFTILAFGLTFWFFGFREGRPELRWWWAYALVSGAVIRWGIPIALGLLKSITGLLIAGAIIAILFAAVRFFRRSASADG